MNQGRFPKNIKLTNDRVGWLESDIDRWIDERIKASMGN
nr:MAG TPA: putative transcriptional regulator [Caudoviricetes sp.]